MFQLILRYFDIYIYTHLQINVFTPVYTHKKDSNLIRPTGSVGTMMPMTRPQSAGAGAENSSCEHVVQDFANFGAERPVV